MSAEPAPVLGGIPSGSVRRRMKVAAVLRAFGTAARSPLFLASAVIILAWVAVIVCAPLLSSYGPNEQGAPALVGPGGAHWFGTDDLGRDVFSRVVHGARVSVVYALVMVVGAMTIGTVIGLVSGFFGGWVDEALMRFVDLFFAFPVVILAMAVAAALGANVQNAVLAGIVVTWPAYARLVRGQVVGLRDSEFVVSSRLAGVGSVRSIIVDIVPSVAGPTIVLATQEVAAAILLLASLSFLGVGAQPPMAEWGAMISAGMNHMDAWWLAVFPGLAIISVALAFNLLGDGLRDAFDPRMKRSARRKAAS